MKVWIESVCLAALAAVGCYLLIDGAGRYRVGKASETWPVTTVTILETTVEKSSSRHSTSYDPIVRYTYTVDGQDYQSDRLQASLNGGSRRTAEKVLERYPVGSQHTGYYDPERPDQAVLLPGTNWKNYLQLGGGLVAILIGTCGIWQAWRGRNQPETGADLPLENSNQVTK